MFNLPQNLKKFDILIEEPFTVFEKFNFLTEEEFDKLQKEFPSESFFQSKHSIGSKKYLNNKNFPYSKKINFNSIRKGEIIGEH